MCGVKFNMVSLYAYKFSAALFCFFGFFLAELGLYLNPVFGFLPLKIATMFFVFGVFVYEWLAFFVGNFGSDTYKGSIVAYASIIIFIFCGFTLFLSIFILHNKLVVVFGVGSIFNTYFLMSNVEKMKKEINKDTDFFKIYFNK